VKGPAGGKGIMLEDEHKVLSFRRFLPAGGGRKVAIVQFFAERGGLRTIEVPDIVDIS
jgi:hypothetical protein